MINSTHSSGRVAWWPSSIIVSGIRCELSSLISLFLLERHLDLCFLQQMVLRRTSSCLQIMLRTFSYTSSFVQMSAVNILMRFLEVELLDLGISDLIETAKIPSPKCCAISNFINNVKACQFLYILPILHIPAD